MGVEARVGVFVLAALAMLVGFVLALGDFRLTPGFVVHADFAYAGGLQSGAPVRVGALSVGRVTKLELLRPDAEPAAAAPLAELGRRGNPTVRARLRLDPEAEAIAISGCTFAVATQGILGDAYVELVPGLPVDVPLAAGQAVRGIDAPRLYAMFLRAEEVLENIHALLAVLEGPANASGGGRPLAGLLEALQDLLVDGGPELRRAITDVALAAATGRQTIEELRTSLAGPGGIADTVQASARLATTLQDRVPALIVRAESALSAVERAAAAADGALAGPALGATLADARAAATELREAARMGRAAMTLIARGEGTVGGLVNDPQVYDDLKEMVRDLKRHPWKVFWRD